MQQITDDIPTKLLLDFLKEHLPKTKYWKIHGFKFSERYYSDLQRWEVIEIINQIITQELDIYFNNKDVPSLHIGNNAAEEAASSIACK